MYKCIFKAFRPLVLAGSVLTAFLPIYTASAAELKWAAQNDILTLDPHAQNHATTNNIVSHTYEPLVRFWDGLERTMKWYEENWQTISSLNLSK